MNVAYVEAILKKIDPNSKLIKISDQGSRYYLCSGLSIRLSNHPGVCAKNAIQIYQFEDSKETFVRMGTGTVVRRVTYKQLADIIKTASIANKFGVFKDYSIPKEDPKTTSNNKDTNEDLMSPQVSAMIYKGRFLNMSEDLKQSLKNRLCEIKGKDWTLIKAEVPNYLNMQIQHICHRLNVSYG